MSEFSRIALMLDGDQAGREATAEIAKRLLPRTFIKMIELPDGAQPDALSAEQLRSFLGSL